MRVIAGRFHVRYSGRIDAELELTDGCVLVADPVPASVPKGAGECDPSGYPYVGAVNVFSSTGLKPRNWMPCGSVILEDTPERLIVEYSRGARQERLEIYFVSRNELELPAAQMHGKLRKLGSEREVGDLLEDDLDVLGEPGLKLVQREFRTSVGPIDLLCLDMEAQPVIVELKRATATPEVIYQLLRYVDALAAHPDWLGARARGLVAAPSISREAQRLAGELGIGFARVRYDDLLERQRSRSRRRRKRA